MTAENKWSEIKEHFLIMSDVQKQGESLKINKKMPKFKFIKDHISGIGEGSVRELAPEQGARLEKEGYCESVQDTSKVVVKDSKILEPEKKKPRGAAKN